MSRLAVIGAGYVGLTTAACMARLGHTVVAADIDADRVALLSKGEVPILEEGLPELLAEGLASKRLRFVVGAANAAPDAEFVFLCVPTPQGDDGSADLSFVEAVAREIAPALRPGTVVVNKSTMPVGSTRVVERILAAAGASIEEIGVASNPEFLREGTSVRDFLEPNRVVIGCDDPSVAVRVSELYRGLKAPILVTDSASAEMIKYASNAFLATKISFINEMANLCERMGGDINDVRRGIGHDQRIGFAFLFPGVGYGGSCFPKDVRALSAMARRLGVEPCILDAVDAVNNSQKKVLLAKIRQQFGERLSGKTFAVWGLAFKPRTDDVREAPALVLIDDLLARGAKVHVHDPEAMANVREIYGDQLVYSNRPMDVLEGADALAINTEWGEFRNPDFQEMKRRMARPVIFDGRNLYDPEQMRDAGFTYYSIGRVTVQPANQ